MTKRLISQETIERVRRDNSFDFLRYLFAFSLILVHFCTLTDTEQFWMISGQTRVKAFFTITGFLVVYSYLRHDNLKTYISKRVRRILPAYITVILFCFVVATLFTSLHPLSYFTQTQTWQYVAANLTMLNFLQPSLPGLFTDNYETAVNGSLWSMKFEVLFYMLIPLMVYCMRKKGKATILLLVFSSYIIYHIALDYMEDHYPDNTTYWMLNHGSFNTMIYFFSGTALILYFDLFCRHIKILFPLSVLLIILLQFDSFYALNYIEPLLFSTIIIGVAYFCKPLNILQHYDNISYGLYLYHYPVIQVLVQFKLHQYNIWLTFALTLIITIALAILSWKFIEKPILRR
jgi:peptidoglycan/LPS O-acetylase OafA/YrhL